MNERVGESVKEESWVRYEVISRQKNSVTREK